MKILRKQMDQLHRKNPAILIFKNTGKIPVIRGKIEKIHERVQEKNSWRMKT